jgi:hypothetical protein
MSTLFAEASMIIVMLSVALYMISIIISKYVQVMYYKERVDFSIFFAKLELLLFRGQILQNLPHCNTRVGIST